MDAALYRLEPFDALHQPNAGVLAELHMELLPTSPATRLGPGFLEHFHYVVLPRAGLVFGALAYVGSQPAGFVAATDDSDSFMRRALRDCWWDLLRALPMALWSHFRVGRALGEVVRLMTARERESGEERIGEVLSLGVRPTFRGLGIVNRNGLSIAQGLVNEAVTRLERSGVTRARAVIDADNLPAQFLYRNLGWRLERTDVPGWNVPCVEYQIELNREIE